MDAIFQNEEDESNQSLSPLHLHLVSLKSPQDDVLSREQKELMQSSAVGGRYSGLQMSSTEDKFELLVGGRYSQRGEQTHWFRRGVLCYSAFSFEFRTAFIP